MLTPPCRPGLDYGTTGELTGGTAAAGYVSVEVPEGDNDQGWIAAESLAARQHLE
ncbi:MAG: hypothetical protein M3Q65_10700 [Chloroflexota bacterium]|nr:hypothetical protein [Chloroflexota bacterium]